jgi:hypothetical protein
MNFLLSKKENFTPSKKHSNAQRRSVEDISKRKIMYHNEYYGTQQQA